MRFFAAILAVCLFMTSALAIAIQKPVIVTFSPETPASIIEDAKNAILEAGGVITHEYKLIRGFAARATEKALKTVSTLSTEFVPTIEEDQVVTSQQHDDHDSTDMASEEDVAAGLIDWVNSLQVAEPVYTVNDFSDGQVIWNVLKHIDRFGFPGKLPEESNDEQWIHKWSNLKHIYDALSIFLVEECGRKLPLHNSRPDLRAIAQSTSLSDTIRLLKLLVVAAINCADRVEFLTRMQDLAEATQEVLMQTAKEAGEDEQDEPDHAEESDEPADSPVSFTMPTSAADSVLESEQRLARVIADNQRIANEKRDLQKQLDDLSTRFTRLQEEKEQSQEEVSQVNERLSAVLSGKAEGGTGRPLESRQESIIATLEGRLAVMDTEIEDLRKTNELLKIKAEKAQKLQDDFDEIKIERDRLSRKANTAEKYRQKLEAVQDLEKDNQNLRSKVNELHSQLKQSDSSRVSSSDLQREIDEYRRLLPSIEQERYELNEMKKKLEFDYHTLEARYQDTHDELARQQRAAEDLQGRLREYEDGNTPPVRGTDLEKTIEAEEAEFAETEARLSAALASGEIDAENGISEDELKAIMLAMQAQARAGAASERETGIRTQKKLLIALERSRMKTKQVLEHMAKQSELITSLQTAKEYPAVTSTSESDTTKPLSKEHAKSPGLGETESDFDELRRLNENLRRELRLISSAWYEQQVRLASSGSAALRTRSGAEPRGFLGKQRQIVDNVFLGTKSR